MALGTSGRDPPCEAIAGKACALVQYPSAEDRGVRSSGKLGLARYISGQDRGEAAGGAFGNSSPA
jgi:hypothetical protein